MRRHELEDEQWELIRDLVEGTAKKGGRPSKDHRLVMNGILWILNTGAPWRDLPERYGPWETVYSRFNKMRRDGVFDKILERLHIKLDEEGCIDWDLFCIDGSIVRASRAAAGAKKGGIQMNLKITRLADRAEDGEQNCT